MKNLYCPWRSDYVKTALPEKKSGASARKCPFCHEISDTLDHDAQNFVLKRFTHNFVILNLYPYNAGHLLIIPYKHKKSLSHYSAKTRAELIEIATVSSDILQKEFGATGVNIGLNLGKSAGAGIPSHLHLHVLPRWFGDTNFLPLLADTKTISFDLNKIYRDLLPKFQKIKL
ncbi:MAG TPA: HIT domain-containing protein [Candidatus Babeliales bacterium]|nr:HIT domain-containing protein [Candidatus Babeliales bacterium]